MKDSKEYILITSIELRYAPWIEDEESNKLQEGKYRSFNLIFNSNIDRISMLIHLKHLKIYKMRLFYRQKSAKNRKIKKVYPQHQMKLFFSNTLKLLSYLSSKNYKIDDFEIRFTNGWVVKNHWLNGLEIITNNTIERNLLLETLISVAGQGPIDVNSLQINKTYLLSTSGEIKLKPIF